MLSRLTFFALLLPTCTLQAQELKMNISNLSFMAGKWFQQHKWGDMEENWSSPMVNCMMCSYRCVKNGKILFMNLLS